MSITKTIPAVVRRKVDGQWKDIPRYSSRNGAKTRILILHTMEGARTVDACGAWFRNPDAPNASSHVGIDDNDTALYVPYEFSAWTAASANPVADQAELAAFAKWTTAEWDAHPGMIERTAQWVAERAKARGIPLVRLHDKQTKTGTGVCMHVDITRGWGVGTHTDCGTNFPIDRIIARAIEINAPEEDFLSALTPDEQREVLDRLRNLDGIVTRSSLGTKLASLVDAGKTTAFLDQYIQWSDEMLHKILDRLPQKEA